MFLVSIERLHEIFSLFWNIEEVAGPSTRCFQPRRIEEKSAEAKSLKSIHRVGKGQPASEGPCTVIWSKANSRPVHLHCSLPCSAQDSVSIGKTKQLQQKGARYRFSLTSSASSSLSMKREFVCLEAVFFDEDVIVES